MSPARLILCQGLYQRAGLKAREGVSGAITTFTRLDLGALTQNETGMTRAEAP